MASLRYKAASILKLYNQMVTTRLLWVLDNVPGLREAAERDEIMFGCVDSWLIYKLTGKHLTEGILLCRRYFLTRTL